MKLEGDYLFDATVPEVWSALFDPVILAAVMPGCEKLELVDGQYVGEIKVKVGPIQGKFTGKVDLKDKDEPRSYTMVVDGRGAPGFVKATAAVKLAPEGERTRVSYDTDAQIGGKIASVGQRLIEASARAIVAQSLEGLHTNIKRRAAAYREAAGEPAAADHGRGEPGAVAAARALTEAASRAAEVTGKAAEAAGKATEAVGKATEAVGKATSATDKATEAVGKAVEAASKAAEAASKNVETTSQGVEAVNQGIEAMSQRAAASSNGVQAAGTPAGAAKVPERAAFTPVKTKQSALANAVAKEVASTLFPRSVLVGIILLQAAVIVWLLLRH
jgi:carbon monoxide dehydrogenase subunit G/uncharacterized protein YjbJ (UPF0337 family)